jgi:hypothetical protein
MNEFLGEILSNSDALSRVLAQYDRLVRQDHLLKDGSILLKNDSFDLY